MQRCKLCERITRMILKKPGPSGNVRVTFSLPASFWADTIHLVGDFNNWNTSTTPLHLDGTCWSATLDLEVGLIYHYRYLINNIEWVNDWQADDVAPSHFGGEDSVVVALLSHEVSHMDRNRHGAKQRPVLRVILGGLADKAHDKVEKQAV